jgi:transcriptional regulator with XRE-family HTH domain
MKYTPMQIQRLKHGLSQEVASKSLGISRSYLSQLETYGTNITEEILYKMIDLYHCDKQDLLSN